MCAHDPTAREGLRDLLVVVFAEAEASQNLLRAWLEGVVDIPVVVILGFELTTAGGDLQDGLVTGGGAFLREEAEVRTRFPLDEAVIRLVLAEDEVEECGLPGAVGADETEAIITGNAQRDLRK